MCTAVRSSEEEDEGRWGRGGGQVGVAVIVVLYVTISPRPM